MNYRIIIVIFLLGFALGYVILSPVNTGAGVLNCYVDDDLCICEEKECLCGSMTVPAEYCDPNA